MHLWALISSNIHRLITRFSSSGNPPGIGSSAVFRPKPLWINICYFVSISAMGFLALKVLRPRDPSSPPKDIDLFFTSVSAATVASMSTVEMEAFSDSQLVVIAILMFIGGEVFVSAASLQFSSRFGRYYIAEKESSGTADALELGVVLGDQEKECKSTRYLCYVVLGYVLVFHISASLLILLHMSFVPSANRVLAEKAIKLRTFAVFTTISSFANCGFIPTNENMIVFGKDSGLLLLIVPLILGGNTLYPVCLWLAIWALKKITKRKEFDHLLKNSGDIGYPYLLPPLHALFLGLSVSGFLVIQFVLFCCMEWSSEALTGMSSYQKIVVALFQSANSRHAGESAVDLSTLAPAVLAFYVVMMYLPPHTAFLPVAKEASQLGKEKRRGEGFMQNFILSPLSYLATSIILICITENQKITEDPVNFSIFNIILEVISAYGTVGFSMGYSCKRRLKQEGHCRDAGYGLAGRWSNEGKLILIVVMFLGRLKKIVLHGGKAWKLG